jgi:hypothetical protein
VSRRHDHQLPPFAASQHDQRQRRLDALISQQPVQIVDTADGRSAEAENDISGSKPGSRRRAVVFNRHNEHARRHRDLMRSSERSRMVVCCPATPIRLRRIRPSRISREATKPYRVARDREADALRGLIIAVLMPITSPPVVTSGPPELPGLSDASV